MAALEFEKEVIEIKQKIKLLQESPKKNPQALAKLKKTLWKKEKATYGRLNSWQKTLMARHPRRPGTNDFIEKCTTGFFQLHGDRHFANDQSIIGGLASIDKTTFMVIGQVKGKTTKENVKHNFGMPHPEGYRKVMRLMQLAGSFNIPILTLVDTPGAYPGIGAEERGQSEAIARCLQVSGEFKVPMMAVVLGEGGSGGALALSVVNRILMLEHSIFGVISPEGCASILWNDYKKTKQAANMLKYTAQDLKKFGIIDEIVTEPHNGAHNQPSMALTILKQSIIKNYNELAKLSGQELINQRFAKFRKIGAFNEPA